MQLATRQRPPPVPPRPSRHVVAEALKRTPRPPCPTRQAPPPPNIRPWRSEDHETIPGRTVVYDSGRQHQKINSGEQVRSSSEPRSFNELLQRPPLCCNNNIATKVEKTADNGTNRATSEKSLLRQRQRQEEPLVTNRRSISDDNILAHNQTDNCRVTHLSKRNKDSTTENLTETCEATKKRVLDKLMLGIDDEYSQISDQEIKTQLNDCVNKNIENWKQIGITRSRSEDDGMLQKRCLGVVEEACLVTPTIFENTLNYNVNDGAKVVDNCNQVDEEFICRKTAEDTVLAGSSSSSSDKPISSDDCATTVVVIEEPERKISSNDDNNDNIYHQDWLEAGIRYSSTKITLPGDDLFDRADEFASVDDNRDNGDDERRTYTKLDRTRIRERMSMSSLQGLPPLPRSLSGFNLSEGRRESTEPPPPPTRSSSKTQKNFKSTQPSSSRPSPPGRQLTTLDTQLAVLRKEMFGLRQLDLSLLSQLWSLNESIQEFRQLLQEQEDRAPSPSPSSEEGDDNSYGSHPPPPPRRPAPLLHHHRLPRPLRPLASDESPSSEEYGAV